MPDRPSTPSGPKPPTGTGVPTAQARDRAIQRPSGAPAPVDARGKTKDLFVSAPKMETPKGGGAIKGIGEKFQANPVTGTASFSVPIALSPGRNGFTPALALSYDSGSGNGPFGLGWSVGVPTISRKTDRGLPRYRDAVGEAEDSDTFVISDAEDLVPTREWNGASWAILDLDDLPEGTTTYARRRYRPRVEGAFARIERWTDTTTGVVHWRSWSRENVRRIYGADTGRLVNPDNAAQVFRWYLEEERDEVGNLIRYEYVTDEDRADAPISQAEGMRALSGNACTYVYLKRVLYGNVSSDPEEGWYFEVVFDYGDHPGDAPTPPSHEAPPDAWPARDDIHSNFRSGFDVRCYRLCERVLLYHRFDDPTGSSEPLLVRSTELAYSPPPSPIATTLTSVTHRGWRTDDSVVTTATMPAVEFTYGECIIDAAVQFVDGVDDLPNGLDTRAWQWADLDGEGLSGLLTEQGGQWFYKRSLGAGELGPARIIRSRPSLATLGDASVRLMDLDGDGRQELVSLRPGMAGSFSRAADNSWEGFRPFRTLPTVDLNDPNVRLLDVDGDGLPDVLVTEDDCFTWYPSEGRAGWGPPEQRRKLHNEDLGPTVIFANPGETILLADMTGDGLTDLVRVRNGNICYWPNKGYGRFGAKIQMAGAPWFDSPDRFDPKRIRLADIDGSGPTDLIYLGPSSVRIWQNQSGNSWSDVTVLPQFPGVEDPASIQVQDLLGDGTACLVWSSPLLRDTWAPLRYVHLMADGKPYLLRTVTNNLGRTTTLTYAPSTQFYVADREAGTPWATRLPFPIQVLEQVRVEDAVTGWSNTTRYAYHHGYYDSDEREFRGFGKVEQWDTEALPLDGLTTDLAPVRTVSWFHTGAWRQQGTLEDAYAAEYFAGDAEAFERVPCAVGVLDTDPAALSARERREAHRALKGQPLRVEVYAEDDDANADVPYTVTETCFTTSRLQRATTDRFGVFLVTPLETLTTHYERARTAGVYDPRVAQELTLEVDEYGTVLRAATVVYPRRGDDHPDAQATGVCLITRNEVIDASGDDRLHLGVPFRTRTWEIVFGETETFFDTRVTATVVADLLPALAGGDASTPVLDFDETLADTDVLRKLADKVTTYDDSGEAPLGEMGERALPYQAYQLAFTATQAAALDARLTALGVSVTVAHQGYVELSGTLLLGEDGEGHWARSGTQVRDADHFYVPTSVTDPFGGTTEITWHETYLFPVSVLDALGNTVAADHDLQALAPASMTDPNGTITTAGFDALGRVTEIRRSNGSEGEADVDEPSQAFSYDLTTIPAVAYATVRTTHGTTTDWIETYAYSDGAGNVVMQKATAAEVVVDTPRWVGSGRVVLNNKGLPIKQYEPFFADSEDFEAEEGFDGVTPVITYDPLGRAIRVDLPNGTLRRIEFSPWVQITFDENDCSDEATTADSALVARAADHVDTPTVVRLDVQGRPYQTREFLTAITSAFETGGTAIETTVTLDVVGNPTVVTDARSNAIQTQTFDLLGRPIDTESPDGGDLTVLVDVAGQPRFVWKLGDIAEESEFDALRRKVRTWEWTTSGTPDKVLRERFVYGESLFVDEGYDPRVDFLRGRLYRVYEGGGLVELGYDWKGNTTRTTRRFSADGETEPDWTAHDNHDVDADDALYPFEGDTAVSVAALHTGAASLLESEPFTTLVTFDALDRVVTSEAPDGQTSTHEYDAGGRLRAVSVDATDIIEEITYNARGQRTMITYGNGTETTHTYETDTFRLATLVTTRASDSAKLQDLRYTYDPVGNIVEIVDAAQETYFFDNTQVTPNQTFTYDALYRLIQAMGREKSNQTQSSAGYSDYAGSAGDLPDGGDGATGASPVLRRYTQSYLYDAVGNILEMKHQNGSGGTVLWRRGYAYETGSNRLVSTSLPGDDPDDPGTHSHTYSHTARGSIAFLPHLRPSVAENVFWNYRDQMVAANLATSGTTSAYAYDAGGQRVRKVVRQGAHTERRYVGGWEEWREYTGSAVTKARTTLHVMDGESRVAMIETLTVDGTEIDPEDQEPVVRFQLGSHLGSVALELDEDGGIISYEEYHPYGSTAWWAGASSTVSQKRYRFTGMERDDETGLQCHGVRYYAVWLGRWVSVDPTLPMEQYRYVRGRVSVLHDRNGRTPTAPLLTLGACAVDTAIPTPSDLESLRNTFEANALKQGFSPDEVQTLIQAVSRGAQENTALEAVFYRTYSSDAFTRMTPEAVKASNSTLDMVGDTAYADTTASGTSINPALFKLSKARIAGILFHELPHTRQGAAAVRGQREAEGYAVEYFVAETTGDVMRHEEIRDTYNLDIQGYSDITRGNSRKFQLTYATLSVLRAIAKGRPVNEALTNGIEISKEEAKVLIAEVLVAKSYHSGSRELGVLKGRIETAYDEAPTTIEEFLPGIPHSDG
jgi:RHS repeat-associated protein